MRAERSIKGGSHIIAAAIIFFAAVILCAVPVRAETTPYLCLCTVSIVNCNDGQWHSAGQSGSPEISGWTEGSFKLSKDRSTLYLDRFQYRQSGETYCDIINAEQDLTVHIIGENTFGKNSFAYVNDANGNGCDLIIEGGSGSSITAGMPADYFINAGSLTIRGCDITGSGEITLNKTMTVNSGTVNVPEVYAGTLHMTGGELIANASDGVGVRAYRELNMEGGTIDSAGPVCVLYDQGIFNCSGGRITSDQRIYSQGSMMLSEDANIQSPGIAAYKGFTGSGGTATGDEIYVLGNMTISGASVTAQSKGVWVTGTLKVTAGDLVGEITSTMGTGNGVRVLGDIILSGGTIQATSTCNDTGRYAAFANGTVRITGGSFCAASLNGPGMRCGGSFSMSSGSFYAETDAEGFSGLELNTSKPVLTNGIWMLEPEDGYFGESDREGYWVCDSSGQPAQIVQFEKVTGIKVDKGPSTKFFNEDAFDPKGLVLKVMFEDEETGDVTTGILSYNDQHKGMFTFDPAEKILSAGGNQIEVTCLDQSTLLNVTAADFAAPKLTGNWNASADCAKLIWKAVDGAKEYEVYAGEPGGQLTLLGTTEKPGYTDKGIQAGKKRSYQVYAVRTSNRGVRIETFSSIVTVTRPMPQSVITPPKKDDPSGTVFMLLQAKSGKVTKTSIQLVWKKVSGARKYVVYGNKCGSKNKYKKLTTTTKAKLTYKKVAGKKVKKGTYYKFIVYALNSKGKVISTSKTVHVATAGGKVGNDKKVTTAAKKNKVTIKKGKTFKLKAKVVPDSKKLKVKRHRKMAYETSNKKIATVTAKGVIKGKKKGTCYVYAYTQNGKFAKVKVTVK